MALDSADLSLRAIFNTICCETGKPLRAGAQYVTASVADLPGIFGCRPALFQGREPGTFPCGRGLRSLTSRERVRCPMPPIY
ncbi:hypothetical protein ELH72_35975 [Rhizobium ruizarguesonis]|nr:hypothetical protein [Rhizobium ruizarguesonis]TAZ68057.1 hypothetical protein ELH72_35975 [Rhizobium ruizarguesonis]